MTYAIELENLTLLRDEDSGEVLTWDFEDDAEVDLNMNFDVPGVVVEFNKLTRRIHK